MQESLRKCSAPVPCFKPKLGEALVNKENQKNGNHRKNQKEITEILFNLKACAKKKDLREGIKVHAHILQRGFLAKNAHLGSSLVCMYAKCGDLVKAEQVFNELPTKNVVAWNARITGCIQCGQASDALKCFKNMKESGISPDIVTFTCILKACGIAGSLSCGKHIHDEILNGGYWGKDMILGNALIDMYAKCDNLSKAREILDELPIQNVVSWNGMVGGYVQQGKHIEALGCFEEMKNKGFSPDPITFSCALAACANLKELRKGKEIHDEIVTTGLLEKNAILGTALVDMYAKCGMLKTAHQVLNQICIRDVVSWNALIAGYAQCGEAEEAMRSFNEMKCEDIPPNAVTFSCILKACGSAGALREGKHVHDEIIQKKLLGKNVVLGTALVDMYAKCGALRIARKVLDDLAMRDVVTWSSLIAGYAQQGEGEKTLECLKEMEHEGIAPNTVTFRSLLQACSYSGLVDEGQMLFTIMSRIYGIIPDLEHHACLVDLFGRAGHFDKVMTIITKIPSSDYPPLWGAVLGMCQKWGNVKLGRLAFEQSVQFNEMNDAAYACMNNIYVAAGMLDDAKEIEAIRRKNFSEEETKYACLCGS